MNSLHSGLLEVQRLYYEGQHDAALSKVDELLQAWPSNARLMMLWAELVQLVDEPRYTLDDVRHTLRQAFAMGVTEARRLLIDALTGQAKALLQLDKRREALECVAELFRLVPNSNLAQLEELLPFAAVSE